MIYYANLLSPSMRRVWIEISLKRRIFESPQSPSMRRVWIEIIWCCTWMKPRPTSPSMRRVWIEMGRPSFLWHYDAGVTLHAEGVD